MALIKKPAGKNWYWTFKYTDEFGKSHNKTFSTGIPSDRESESAKAKARKEGIRLQIEFLDDVKKSQRNIENLRRSHQKDTFKEYSEFWLNEIQGTVMDNTLVSYREPLYSHIIPLIGHIPIIELDQFDIKMFINRELEECDRRQAALDTKKDKSRTGYVKVKNAERPFYYSIKKHLDIIRMILEYAVCEGDLEENVCKKVNKQFLKKIPRKTFESDPYSLEEIIILRKSIKGHVMEPAIILASYLGLRREEVLGLRWQDVDFENRKIYIRNVCVRVGTEDVYREKTKTKDSKAAMYMVGPLYDFMIELKKKQEREKAFVGKGYYDSDLVCRWEDGRPLKTNYVSHCYPRLIEQAGLRKTRFHDLRKTVGCIILESTNDIKLAQQVLRHSNIGTTANIYAKHNEEAIAKGLQLLDTSALEDDEN